MGFDEGSLTLDRPDRTYYAGETVYGTLEFRQEKAKSVRGIYVKVKGYAHTHWTTHHTRRDANGKTHSYTVSHDGHEDYFNSKQYIVGGSSGEHRIQPGVHKFSFQCPIPNSCPSSFEGEYGHIRYEVKVVVDRAFKLDQEKRIGLDIIAPLDLNSIATINEPLQLGTEESYCCWCVSSGNVETRVKLPAAGACPGERMPVELACDNRSNVEINKIKLAIKKDTMFRAHSAPGSRSGSRQTVLELQKGPVPANTSRTWTLDLVLPDDAEPCSLNNCSIIDLDYFFKMTVSPSGCHTDTELEEKFVIGTEPLRGATGAPAPVPRQQVQPTNAYYPTPNPFMSPNQPYPGGNEPYPGANQPYPGANQPYPGASQPYPGANQPYPGANQPYPGGNLPYPGVGPSYPSANPPPYDFNSAPSPYYQEKKGDGTGPTPGPYPGAYPAPPVAATPYPGPVYPEKSERGGLVTSSAPPPPAGLGFLPPQGPTGPAASHLPYPFMTNMPQPHSAGGAFGGGGSGGVVTSPSAPEPSTPDTDQKPGVADSTDESTNYAFNPSIVPPERQKQ